MQLVVLGMHRSGTSALARLLGLMGAWLGEGADFTPARPDNPAGDGERRDVWALDEDALAAAGASWQRIAGLELERLDAAVRRGLERRAREIVRRLDEHRPWAIKDPRLCLLLPLWRPALDAPVCVLIWRRPVQVAESLRDRDGLPLPVGVALWEHHVLGALQHSRGLPRVLVSHARLIADPAGAAARLHAELEASGVRGLVVPAAAALERSIDAGLHHARGADAAEREIVTEPQRLLAAALEDSSALGLDPLPAPSLGARELLAQLELRHERERLAADLVAAQQHIADLRGERERLAARAATAEQALGDVRARAEALEEQGCVAARRERELDDEIRHAVAHADELQALVELVLGSRRWRFGDRAGELYRRTRLRPAQPPASAHAARIVLAYREWRRRALARLAPAGARDGS